MICEEPLTMKIHEIFVDSLQSASISWVSKSLPTARKESEGEPNVGWIHVQKWFALSYGTPAKTTSAFCRVVWFWGGGQFHSLTRHSASNRWFGLGNPIQSTNQGLPVLCFLPVCRTPRLPKKSHSRAIDRRKLRRPPTSRVAALFRKKEKKTHTFWVWAVLVVD